MPRLVLIKHSMPAIDPSRPAREWELSEEGALRCDWLVQDLAALGVEEIYSSPERKAFQTAEIVAENLGLETRTVEGLHENDRTDFPFIEDTTEFERRFEEFFANPDERKIGNESANEALARFSSAIASILDESPDTDLAVVAHGTVISLYAAATCGIDAFETWKELNPLPAWLSIRTDEQTLECPPRSAPD